MTAAPEPQTLTTAPNAEPESKPAPCMSWGAVSDLCLTN